MPAALSRIPEPIVEEILVEPAVGHLAGHSINEGDVRFRCRHGFEIDSLQDLANGIVRPKRIRLGVEDGGRVAHEPLAEW